MKVRRWRSTMCPVGPAHYHPSTINCNHAAGIGGILLGA